MCLFQETLSILEYILLVVILICYMFLVSLVVLMISVVTEEIQLIRNKEVIENARYVYDILDKSGKYNSKTSIKNSEMLFL